MNDWKPMQDVHPAMLLCAFRYSLGRRTYITSTCVEWLEKWWDCLPEGYQRQVHGDIKDAIKRGRAGDKCDIESWQKVLEFQIKEHTND